MHHGLKCKMHNYKTFKERDRENIQGVGIGRVLRLDTQDRIHKWKGANWALSKINIFFCERTYEGDKTTQNWEKIFANLYQRTLKAQQHKNNQIGKWAKDMRIISLKRIVRWQIAHEKMLTLVSIKLNEVLSWGITIQLSEKLQ